MFSFKEAIFYFDTFFVWKFKGQGQGHEIQKENKPTKHYKWEFIFKLQQQHLNST